MTGFLLDANVLIASVFADHEHHGRVSDWFEGAGSFAVCPIVEGALVRFTLRVGESPATAAALVAAVRDNPRIEFWGDDISYADVDLGALRGHRQVTDAYLAALAASRGLRLATLDEGLAASHPDGALLIPGL